MPTSVAIFTIAGTALVAAVGVQLGLGAWGTWRRLLWQREQEQRSQELFQKRLDAARALQARYETTQYAWNGYRKFLVDRKVCEAEGICSFYLVPHDRKPLPSFLAGQFLTLQLRIPSVEKPVIRCYSLSDAPRQDQYRITVKRCPAPRDTPNAPPGLVSNYLHDQLDEGHLIDVKAPTGKFYIDPEQTKPAVLIAGGVGITPLFCMVSAVVASGSAREVWLFYGVRNGRDHALREQLRELDHKNSNVRVVTCYSSPAEQDLEGRDFDHAGRITTDLLQSYLETNNYEFFVCGPPPMMAAITKSLAEWGVPKADIRTEAFGPASVPKKSPPKDTKEKPAVFKVEFAKSKKVIDWDGKFDSLLDLGDSVGAEVEGGCRAGNCGTCEIAVLSGEVEYNRDPEYPDIKEGCCLACIGVPKGNLVLDA